MNELLQLAIDPIWFQVLFALFLLRTIYRVIVRKFYISEKFAQIRESRIRDLKRSNSHFQKVHLNMTWMRSRVIWLFLFLAWGIATIYKFNIADPELRILLNMSVAIASFLMFEQYAKSIEMKRELEAAIETRV